MTTSEPDVSQWLVRTDTGEPRTVAAAREQLRADSAKALAVMDPALVPASQEDISVPGRSGPIPVRVLRPVGDGPHPTVVYFHGGGWVLGDLDTHLGQARRLCTQGSMVVVMAGFRRAPEHRFPAAFDDGVDVTTWAADHLVDLGGDTSTLVVSGDSAGGQLAASVAIARRDAGQPLSAQLLLYPVTDVAGRYVDEKINAHYWSRRSSQHGYGLTLDAMVSYSEHYVDAGDAADWRVSPIRAADLTGVAPAVIHTATLDVLRTEGNFYADALRAAGVDVISREYPTLNHSYFGAGGVSAVADAASAEATQDVHEILRRRPA